MKQLAIKSEEFKKARENMEIQIKSAKEKIMEAEDVTIYTHTDCDGVTAGSVLSTILDRLDKPYHVEFTEINELEDKRCESDLALISDLGAGQDVSKIITPDQKMIILDHHPPIRKLGTQIGGGLSEVNPNFYGLDGSYTISGGGLSYLLAKTFNFYDLSWMGVLSAVGDMQNSSTGKLRGLNREILSDAKKMDMMQYQDDLVLYGRHTRPLFVALSYFGDVHLPLTNNRNECVYFLEHIGIPVKDDLGNTRYLCDLSFDEKAKLFNELLIMMTREVPKRYVKYVPKLIFGESYEFTFEDKYTQFKDASEYSTVVNACARNKKFDLALKSIKTDRLEISDELSTLVKSHKRYLAQSMSKLSESEDVEILDNIQYFDGGDIRSNVVGTIAGMILNNYDWKKPIMGYTHIDSDTPTYKVSLRCSKLLSYDGIHFGNLMGKIAAKCGGSGGGHSVACGAYIPEENMEKFINLMNTSITLPT